MVYIIVGETSNIGRRYKEDEQSSSSAYKDRYIRMDPSIQLAAKKGDARIFHTPHGRLLSDIRTFGGNSVLHIYLESVEQVNDSFIREMIDYDKTLLYARNNNEELPHHLAAKHGFHVALNLLLEIGGYTFLELTTKEGYNVLHLAIQKSQVETVRYLAGVPNTAYMIKKSEFGDSSLHMAIGTQYPELVEILVETKPDLIALQDRHGQTALHYAAKLKDTSILKLLLSNNASLEALEKQDKYKQTVAHVAAKENNADGLKLLKHIVPDYFETLDISSQNVVHHAANGGCGEALQYFFENKDKCFCNLLDKKDKDGNTPIHLLILSLPKFSMQSTIYIKQHVIPHIEEPLMREKNRSHHTPQDILDRLDTSDLRQDQKDLVTQLKKVYQKQGQNDDCEINLSSISEEDNKLFKVANESIMLPALLATFSYTAILTVPGGFNQNQSDKINGGTAMLLGKPAFKAFFVLDSIALMFSIVALLIHLFLALLKWEPETLDNLAYKATVCSFFSLLVAIIPAVYSIVWTSPWLSDLMLVIFAIPILCFGALLWCFIMRRLRG